MNIRTFCILASIAALSLAMTTAMAAPMTAVSLLKVPAPNIVLIRDLTGSSMLGGTLDHQIEMARGVEFRKAVIARKYDFAEVLVGELRRSFKGRNIEMMYLEDQASTLAADKKSDDYSAVKVGTDAILEVWFGPVGFLNTAKPTMIYKPVVVINAKLIDAKTFEVLFLKTYNVGYEVKLKGVEYIAIDKKFHFGDYNSVVKRMDVAFDAFRGSEKIVADRVVSDLALALSNK
jgi:hypothetical protein